MAGEPSAPRAPEIDMATEIARLQALVARERTEKVRRVPLPTIAIGDAPRGVALASWPVQSR